MQTSRMVLSTLFALLLVVGTGQAWAHKVNIFAYVEGATVRTESYFPDGKPVEGGQIEVFDAAGGKLLEGLTDPKGLFAFPLPKKEDLTIVINASMGHKNSFLLKKSEM